MNGYRSTLGTRKVISVAPSRKALTCAIVCSRASSMSITMPCIMTDSEQPPLRLIARWKYDPASDSFHIGRGLSFHPPCRQCRLIPLSSAFVPGRASCVRFSVLGNSSIDCGHIMV